MAVLTTHCPLLTAQLLTGDPQSRRPGPACCPPLTLLTLITTHHLLVLLHVDRPFAAGLLGPRALWLTVVLTIDAHLPAGTCLPDPLPCDSMLTFSHRGVGSPTANQLQVLLNCCTFRWEILREFNPL